MSQKTAVLKRFPDAYLWHWADGFCIYSGETVNRMLGKSGQKTPRQAWASAGRVKGRAINWLQQDGKQKGGAA